jgi:hypothetical protein
VRSTDQSAPHYVILSSYNHAKKMNVFCVGIFLKIKVVNRNHSYTVCWVSL